MIKSFIVTFCVAVALAVASAAQITSVIPQAATTVPSTTSNAKPDTIFNEKLVEGVVIEEPTVEMKKSSRRSRQRVTSMTDALKCGLDFRCFLDIVELVVNQRKHMIFVQADAKYLQSTTARASSTESPSELADAVEGIISKMTDIVKGTVSSWFQDDKEEDETADIIEVEKTDDEEEEEEEDDGESKTELTEETRGKKKKKLKSLMKLLILGAVLKAKLTVLLQLLSAALQIKFFFIALTGLLINKIRLWYDLKKGHHPQKVIYYEHAQHQHHYDHAEDDHHGGFWGRTYEVPEDETAESAQDLAYRGQRPQRPIPWNGPSPHHRYD